MRAAPKGGRAVPSIALIDWSHLLEDLLDHLGVTFETFRDEFMDSWMFGYIAALRVAGVRTVLFWVSARVIQPWRFTHRPTGTPVCTLPAPRAYRAIRRRALNPYAPNVEQAVGSVEGIRYVAAALQKEVAPYFATPIRLLAQELRREGCQALLCQEYEHARFDICVLLGCLMRLPVFATFQGGDAQLSRIERFTRPLSLRACAGVIIAARSEADRVRRRYKVSSAKRATIFNLIDVAVWHGTARSKARRALGIPEEARMAVWHGRVLLQRKGLDVLLNAWEQVRAQRSNQDLRLLLVGSGNNAAELRQRLAVRSLTGVVWVDRFIQDRAILRTRLAAAEVYVSPSRHESFPVALIEAMSCGLAVIAAAAPGVTDILEGGEEAGGLVVPCGDTVALAEALGWLLGDDVLSRELGLRARRRSEAGFSFDAVGKQLRSLIYGSMDWE